MPKFERLFTVLPSRHKIISYLTFIDGVFICISHFTMQSTYRVQQNPFGSFIHIILRLHAAKVSVTKFWLFTGASKIKT